MSADKVSVFQDHVPLWCSLASRMLGWKPNEFWQSTPAELAAAIRDPEINENTAGPSRDCIAQMLKREENG